MIIRSGFARYVVLSAAAALGCGLAGSSVAQAPQSDIARGAYLARAGDCVSCHTAVGGAPFAGGLRMDTPFGYMLTPNITPDPDTGIGRWSSDDFQRALHNGVNARGQDMYPVMPFDFYTRVTPADVAALFAYLRTVKPVRNAIDVNHLDFPFDMRWSMTVWRELYFTAGTYRPDAAQTAAWNRGGYLVEGLGHCSDCHSPRNLLGGIEKSKDFSGAVVDGWFALDLTSDISTGLGAWSATEIATYLRTGVAHDKTTTLGPMAEVIRNSLVYLTDADRLAMADYLKALPPDSRLRTGRLAADPTRLRGSALYSDHCSACHQANGQGINGVFPPLAGNPVVLAADPNDIVKVITRGINARNGFIAMPAFGARLTETQIADLANYVRTSWGNKAAANATPAGVGAIQAAPN